MPAGGRRSGPALRACAGRAPHLCQAVSAMDQDSEIRPPLGSGSGSAGGNHDITRHQTLQEGLSTSFEVG